MRDKILFAKDDLGSWLRVRRKEALAATRAIPPDKVLSVPESDLVQELVDQYSVKPPRLKLEDRMMETRSGRSKSRS